MIRFNEDNDKDNNPRSHKRGKYLAEEEEIQQLAVVSEDNIHLMFGNLTLDSFHQDLESNKTEDKLLWQNTILKFFPYLAFTKKDKFESFPYTLFAKEYCEYKVFALKNQLNMKYFKSVVLPAVSGQFDSLQDIPTEYWEYF